MRLGRRDGRAGRRLALWLALALAVGLAFALSGSTFHVVPTRGQPWRGVMDPPGAARLALSLLAGAVAAALLVKAIGRRAAPLVALALAGAPLVPVLTGFGPELLVFQGPVMLLLTVSVTTVVLVETVSGRVGRLGRVPGWALFLVGLAYLLALGTRVPGPAGPQGDEPHYLLMTHSLLADADLDLANQHAERHYAPFYGGTLEPHLSTASPPGTAYSLHPPGLAFVMLPGYALGGYPGARATLCLLVALAAVLLRRVVREAGASEAAALATWAVVTLTPPLPFYALALYPETAAFCGVALLLWLRRSRIGPGRALAAAAVAAALVWLHPKFLPLGIVGLALVLRRAHRRAAAAAVVLYAAIVAGFLLDMWMTFGRATLSAGLGNPHLRLLQLPWGVLAELFDRQWGLFAVGPVWMLAAFGVVRRLRRDVVDAVELLLLAAVPIAVGATYALWWGGACPPARFVVPGLPALAVFLATAMSLRPRLSAALAGLGFGIVLLAARMPRVLHNVVTGESGLLRHLGTLDLNGFFPSFFDARRAVPVVLALSLAAACALAWRYGARGLALGAVGFALVAGSLRDRPLIDAREAGLDVLWAWDRDNWSGPVGPPDLAALAIPLELRGTPWTMAEGEAQRSRSVNLPPGAYELAADARSTGGPSSSLLIGARARGVPLAAERVPADDPLPLPVVLPVGAPGLRLEVEAAEGGSVVQGAALRPQAVVARSERADLAWPERLRPERYRLARGTVSVTPGDDVEPEGDGFRLQGTAGSFVIDGPARETVTVHVRRSRPDPDDQLTWAGRSIRLGRLGEVVLQLPMETRVLPGHGLVSARLRSTGAWVRFFGESTGTPR